MNVLFVSNGFPPDRWAGTERHTAALAGELTRRGAVVSVLCAGAWDSGPESFNGFDDAVADGACVRRLNLNWTKAPDPFRWLFDNPVTAAQLDRLIEERRPDVVHVTSCETLSASVLRTVKSRALPLVLSLTDFWFLCPRLTLLRTDGAVCSGITTAGECVACLARNSKVNRWPRRFLPADVVDRILGVVAQYPVLTRQRGLRGMVGDVGGRKRFLSEAIGWPDARLTASPFVRSVYHANGIRAPIDVRPYGHDLSWLESGDGRRTPSETVRIGYVGQVERAKGLHVLLAALRRLRPEVRRRLSVLVYGDLQRAPAYAAEIGRLAASLENVRFMGTYGYADSAATYASFDVLVVPSLWYDFPLVIHEAFATRTPVIATDLGGMAEAIEPGENGLLFPAGDADGLARHLEAVACRPELLARLRDGIRPVKTIEAEGEELEELYGRLLTACPA